MSERINLRHLTFVGPAVETATVEFGPEQTYIIGPSNTGKSYIADALDFMFGASSLRSIPEAQGYTRVILCLTLANDSLRSFVRSVDGGRFEVYEGDIRELPVGRGSFSLAARNNAKSVTNMSQFLLNEIGMRGTTVRVNSRNDTRLVSLRDVTRLCLVDELSMQETRSPILSPYYANNTAERSLFRVLLESLDDSDLEPTAPSPEAQRTSRSNIALLDSMIVELEESLENQPTQSDLNLQLGRLSSSIAEATSIVESYGPAREQLLSQRDALTNELRSAQERAAEIRSLTGRFLLLREQYTTDLDRLETVEEAGQLLGFMLPGVCPFCGAETEHQHPNVEVEPDSTGFATAVASEISKTEQLRTDLDTTLSDLEEQRVELVQQASSLDHRRAVIDEQVADLERQARPASENLRELLEARSSVERRLGMYEQIDRLEKRRVSVEPEVGDTLATRELSPRVARSFSEMLRSVGIQLGVPDASNLFYDVASADIVAGDQPRASHGKGMRALLHAAFNVALSEYCLSADLHHPGFLVLDSPVVTYRGPDSLQDGAFEEFISIDVADTFFANLNVATTAQSVVLENREPPSDVPETATIIHFTKSLAIGRYGLFPPRLDIQAEPSLA